MVLFWCCFGLVVNEIYGVCGCWVFGFDFGGWLEF